VKRNLQDSRITCKTSRLPRREILQMDLTITSAKSVYLTLITFCLLLCTAGQAQMYRGDKYYEKHDYQRALEAYEKAYVDNFSNSYLTRKIADSYRNLGDVETSLVWYKRTLEMDQSEQADMLYYAQALKTIEDYPESQKWYDYYGKLRPEDSRAASHMKDERYYITLMQDSADYNINKLEMNTDKPEFGISRFGNKMLFSSAGVTNPGMKSKWDWEDPYMDVYEGRMNEVGEMVEVKKLEGNVNSKYHDGPVWYDEEHGELYITRNNEKKGKPVLDEHGRVNLKIYRTRMSGGQWGKVEELSVNSNDHSNAHPTVSSDGTTLYFSSNRPGGIGGNDIYMCKRMGDDWSEPVNLGRPINSEGDEMFPTTSPDGRLYFGSDGHAGLGSMDIFYTEEINGIWSLPTNMGYPINTSRDDFGMVADEGGKSGYFCSNRNSEKIQDDIYRFALKNNIRIKATVGDKSVLAGFDHGILRLYNEDGEFVGFFEDGGDGNGYLEMEKKEGEYRLEIDSEDWDVDEVTFVIDEDTDDSLDLGNLNARQRSYAALPDKDFDYTALTTDYTSGEAISGIKVEVFDKVRGEVVHTLTTSDKGDVKFDFAPGVGYRIDFSKEGYQSKSFDIVSTEDDGLHSLNDELDLKFSKIELGAALDIANIYYDFDKYNIRADARPQLDEVAQILNDNKNLTIAINSHTDSQGAASYNEPRVSIKVDLLPRDTEKVS